MATTITRKIKVLSYSIPVRVPYVQNSNMIGLKFELEDFTIPSGSTARVYVKKPSGAEVYNSATISSNTISFTPTTQMVAEVGEQPLQIQVTSSSGTVLVTFPIILDVEKNYISSSAVQSTNEYDTLTTLVKNATSAISSANSAASRANTATTNANNATTNANTAAASANTAASTANTAADKANTAATNADGINDIYNKVKDSDFSTYATAITNTLSVTGATTSPQAKKVTNLSGLSSPESWNTGFLMGDTSSGTVKIAGFGAIPSTSASMDNVDSNSGLFGITATSNPYMKRFRLIDIFSSVSFGTLTTTAKTIIGAINELKTSLASNVAYVDATLDNISINSGNVVFKDFTMSKDGYTCIGVIMVQLSNGSTNGSGSSGCICTGFYPTSTGVHVNIRNQGSSTAIIKVTARGLFVKN